MIVKDLPKKIKRVLTELYRFQCQKQTYIHQNYLITIFIFKTVQPILLVSFAIPIST